MIPKEEALFRRKRMAHSLSSERVQLCSLPLIAQLLSLGLLVKRTRLLYGAAREWR